MYQNDYDLSYSSTPISHAVPDREDEPYASWADYHDELHEAEYEGDDDE